MDKSYKLKLTYFALTGRAEPIRLMLHRAGIPFENVTLSKEEFGAKKTSGELPFGQLPVMEIDGKLVAQSNGLGRFAARLSKHYPEDLFLAAKCDEVLGLIDEIKNSLPATFMEPDPAKQTEMRKKLAENQFQTILGHLEKLLEQNGTGFFVGNSLTWADIEIYTVPSWLLKMDGIPASLFDKFPKLKANMAKVDSDPKIAEWNEKHNKK